MHRLWTVYVGLPFGSISIHERKAQRCNQCPDLDTPACIKACSKRAIAMVDPEKLIKEKQKQHLEKLTGLGKKKKKKGLIDLITTKTKAKKPYTGRSQDEGTHIHTRTM